MPSTRAATSWAPLFLLPAAMVILTPIGWPPWALMWLLAFAIYVSVKWLTWWSLPTADVSATRHLAYLLGWPGLDASSFLLTPADEVEAPTSAEWIFAALKLLLGLLVLYAGPMIVPASQALVVGWTGMVGIVFSLHFGLFHLLSCFWRCQGMQARPLMQWPIASRSMSEFWGRRWNTAFRDLAYRFLFRPLSRRCGATAGLALGFLFSGIAHDVVISYPAGGGYGGPTLYFTLQAGGALLERKANAATSLLKSSPIGWAFTFLVVAGPAGLLFHPPFLRNIVLPFMQAIGAI